MPWSNERKRETRHRILDAAARCFTQRGYDAVSIDEVMADAGLTRVPFTPTSTANHRSTPMPFVMRPDVGPLSSSSSKVEKRVSMPI